MIPVTVQEKLFFPQLRSLQVYLLSVFCIALLRKKTGFVEKPTTLCCRPIQIDPRVIKQQ